jgi:uncharacterized glyoxalase superfamily protein PhnB
MSDVVPYFGYRDAPAALDFLAAAFGFTETERHLGADGGVTHAEMSYRGGVIMVSSAGPAGDAALGRGGVYLVVDDVDAHHRRAVAAGATVVYPPEDTGFGPRRYRARDPEGYEWSFGGYRPEAQAQAG